MPIGQRLWLGSKKARINDAGWGFLWMGRRKRKIIEIKAICKSGSKTQIDVQDLAGESYSVNGSAP